MLNGHKTDTVLIGHNDMDTASFLCPSEFWSAQCCIQYMSDTTWHRHDTAFWSVRAFQGSNLVKHDQTNHNEVDRHFVRERLGLKALCLIFTSVATARHHVYQGRAWTKDPILVERAQQTKYICLTHVGVKIFWTRRPTGSFGMGFGKETQQLQVTRLNQKHLVLLYYWFNNQTLVIEKSMILEI